MIFIPLLLWNFFWNPSLLVRFLAVMAPVSSILTFHYFWRERDMDFVYGILYSYYAFFLLKWIRPYAFLTLRNGRWMTR